jgi:hydroxyacylglutathione hydrolase
MRQISQRAVSAHALTHAHPDHQGASHAICERLGIPLWCGQGDIPAMETPGGVQNSQAPGWLNRLQQRYWTGPPHPVARALVEGDEVAGFTVLETPGHSRGHVAYWRESDRVLILGDVLNGMNVLTGRHGLHEPPLVFTPDPARNRESARRLARLRPLLTCFGHGPPLRDPGTLADFIARLPD